MNDVVVKGNINIESMIYEIRGKQVILDSDISIIKWHNIIFNN